MLKVESLHRDHANRFKYESYNAGLTLVQSQNKLRIFLKASVRLNLAGWLLPTLSNGLIDVMMMMMNCLSGMVDRRKAFSLISSREHCQRSSPSRISDTPRAGFEPAHNLEFRICWMKLCSCDNHYKPLLFTGVYHIFAFHFILLYSHPTHCLKVICKTYHLAIINSAIYRFMCFYILVHTIHIY